MGQLIRKRLSATKSTFRRIYQSIKVWAPSCFNLHAWHTFQKCWPTCTRFFLRILSAAFPQQSESKKSFKSHISRVKVNSFTLAIVCKGSWIHFGLPRLVFGDQRVRDWWVPRSQKKIRKELSVIKLKCTLVLIKLSSFAVCGLHMITNCW
jgi:hypothetical protein